MVDIPRSTVARPLVVIPTLNEAPTIDKAVSGARAADVDVLVVDDGSTDATSAIVQRLASLDPGVNLLQRDTKMGLGTAYRDGFAWGMARGYDAFGEMDADLSHDPGDLPTLLAGLAHADLVIGSRYVAGGGVEDWPVTRRLLSRGANTYVRLCTGLPVHDATAGFRFYRRSVIDAVDTSSSTADGYAFQIEMALRTWLRGFVILEVPITFTERQEGVSKMSRAIVAEALWRVPRWGLQARFRRGGRAG
ncbi:MAG TPA: polyprenol monophosphomannose synthase [Euzebya sp.]|nr:polyprenol monophosphomannose synthase [Euzebya sp.]